MIDVLGYPWNETLVMNMFLRCDPVETAVVAFRTLERRGCRTFINAAGRIVFENRGPLRDAIRNQFSTTASDTRCALIGHMLAHQQQSPMDEGISVAEVAKYYTDVLGHTETLWKAYDQSSMMLSS